MVNYNAIYESLIARAKNRTLHGYKENHHIVPKCMGGTDNISNLVYLTADEHFVAHQLLVKMFPENGNLIFAAHMMTRSNGRHIRNNKEYSWLKKRRSEYISKISKGVKRTPYGKRKKLQDPYVSALNIENFRSIEIDYTKYKSTVMYLSARDVQIIHSILWTYDK